MKLNRDILCDFGYEDSIFFENPDYDAAIIGATTDGNIVYDYEKMIGCLMDEDHMDYDEAVDFCVKANERSKVKVYRSGW